MIDVRTTKEPVDSACRGRFSVRFGCMAIAARDLFPWRDLGAAGDTGGTRHCQRDRHQALEALQGHALLREGVE